MSTTTKQLTERQPALEKKFLRQLAGAGIYASTVYYFNQFDPMLYHLELGSVEDAKWFHELLDGNEVPEEGRGYCYKGTPEACRGRVHINQSLMEEAVELLEGVPERDSAAEFRDGHTYR